ncbi:MULTISPECIES: hypothetical protein [Streptomyces]|uniref:hypothetical protein n=1 Tax=Streptomyces TaxID=1883 RepID=UPI0004C9BB61|nr:MULTISPECIES: hypothetical protein [Streptomyces]
MFPLLLVSIVITALAGWFANPVWWVASAVLAYLAVRYRQGYLGYDAEYRAYRERRIRQDRWDKRYRAERGNRASKSK